MAGLVEGMGFEEVNQNVTETAIISGTNVYAATALTTPTVISTTLSGTNIRAGNDLIVGSTVFQGYADSEGQVINNVAAEAIISGGMWVTISGASGATFAPVAKPAPIHTSQPIGICLANAASGANVNILVKGFYQGLVAEDTVTNGLGLSMGSGAALNTAIPGVGGKTRGICTMAGGSEAVVGVYLL